MAISKDEIFTFLNAHRLAVVSTLSVENGPQSALVYAVPTPDLELIFYTLQTTRKCANLRRNPRVSLVIGWPSEGERGAHQDTVQYEGIAEEQAEGPARDAAKAFYLESLPQNAGMATWPGLTYFRVKPSWIRFSTYGKNWRVEELTFDRPQPARKRGLLEKFLR